MKLLHRVLNSGWFRFLAAFGFGWIIHDPCGLPPASHQLVQHGRQADPIPKWGLLAYGGGLVCGFVGVFFTFLGSFQAGSWLIGASITIILSTALTLGQLRKW